MFEDFQNGTYVKTFALEREMSDIPFERLESLDSTVVNRFEIADALRRAIDRRDAHFRKRIQERPEEDAAPATDIKQFPRSNPVENTDDLADAGQLQRPLELVQPQASLLATFEEFVGIFFRYFRQPTSHERGCEVLVKVFVVHGYNLTESNRFSALKATLPMSKVFDSTMKSLLESSPTDWPRLLGHVAEKAEVIDADIATISGAADKVIKVEGKPDWIQHLEFQAGPDALKPRKLNVYNAILEDRHDCPVHSALILLSPKANLTIYSGVYENRLEGRETPYRVFRYDVVRVWELSPETILQGGIGLLPLAPLTKVQTKDLPELLLEMNRIVELQNDPERSSLNWVATDQLMKLRFDDQLIAKMIQGVLKMEHSAYFQSLLDRGAVERLHETLLEMGEIRFGVPSDESRQRIESIASVADLKQLCKKLLIANSWEELLHLPAKKPRRRRQEKEN